MSLQVKICGLRDASGVLSAVAGGARFVGFVFYEKSPRAVTASVVAPLLRLLPDSVASVGLFVDPDDQAVTDVLREAPLSMIQLHGKETPQRVAALRQLTGLPVIKAVGISGPEDLAQARLYEPVADYLLLDAKAPVGAIPGGNARAFDWTLLKGTSWARPWLLAGGLCAANIEQAVAATGARLLDVSSGVEDTVGCKSPAKINEFLTRAGQIETCC